LKKSSFSIKSKDFRPITKLPKHNFGENIIEDFE